MNRKIALATAVAAILLLGATHSQAAFTSRQISTITATAITGGVPTASFTLSLNDVVTPTVVRTNISWSGAMPAGGWKIADTLIRLAWNVTDSDGGIQIYTDNTNIALAPTANPRFVDPSAPTGPTDPNGHNLDSNPAGLVQVPLVGVDSPLALPVAWSIKASTMVVGLNDASRGILPADPDLGAETGAANKYQWLYMKDKATPAIDLNGDGDWTDPWPGDGTAFANADNFITVAKQTGIHGAQGPTDFFADADHVSYVYLQSDFTNAAAQTTYRTNQLKVEAFIQ